MKKLLLLLATATILSAANAQVYDALNATLLSNWFNPAQSTAQSYGIKYNGIWAWTDGSSNEYAIVCSASGTYFIDVTDPSNPVERDYVAGARDFCVWREAKTYGNYCYVVSDDQAPNSFQIIDMSYLPDSVHVVYDSNTLFERAHTIYIEGDKLYAAYVHGGSTGYAPMAVYSLADPENPVLLRNLSSDFSLPMGQVHDMMVRGDTIYASCGYDGLFIFLLNSSNQFVYINSLTSYIDQGYNHSSALTDDGSHLFFTDEVPDGMDVKSLNVSDLSNLTIVDNFHSNDDATPHNPFIKGDILYIAYYMDGLQVYDISDPDNAVRIAFFDTYHQNAPGSYPSPAYAGAWGAYPWLPSGNILVSDMQNGLFVIDVSVPTALTEKGKSLFSMHPNPVARHDDVRIRLDSGEEAEVTISDLKGKIVKRFSIKDDHIINAGSIQAGIYQVTVNTATAYKTEKLVITE